MTPRDFLACAQEHGATMVDVKFTDLLTETWIRYKGDNEVEPLRLRLPPQAFYLYYDN